MQIDLTSPLKAEIRPYVPTFRDRTDHLTWDALSVLGDLTRLANEAQTVSDALYLHARINAVVEAALGAVGVAMTQADRF